MRTIIHHVEEPEAPPLVSRKDVVASGLAGVTVAVFSSKLGVEGTLFGAGLASMVGTASTSIYKAYLPQVETSERKPPGALALPAALWWFLFQRPPVRRSVVRTGLLAGVIACIIGLGVLTSVEQLTRQSFSCLIWNECLAGASETQPSIMGGSPVVDGGGNGGGGGDIDTDGDGLFDAVDNCTFVFNQDQTDTDGDWIGDLCDDTPSGSGEFVDTDGDGVPDDQDPDDDSDGTLDDVDLCLTDPNC